MRDLPIHAAVARAREHGPHPITLRERLGLWGIVAGSAFIWALPGLLVWWL